MAINTHTDYSDGIGGEVEGRSRVLFFADIIPAGVGDGGNEKQNRSG
jgi:hypothetical protein